MWRVELQKTDANLAERPIVASIRLPELRLQISRRHCAEEYYFRAGVAEAIKEEPLSRMGATRGGEDPRRISNRKKMLTKGGGSPRRQQVDRLSGQAMKFALAAQSILSMPGGRKRTTFAFSRSE